MPSVIVTWSGQLRDLAAREELSRRMADLGKLSHGYIEGGPADLKRYDGRLEGDVLLSSHIFASPPSSSKLTRISEELYSVRSLALTGFEFRVFGVHTWYPGDDRMNFVFTVDDDPELDGLMVYAEDHQECLKYTDVRIRRADHYLAIPHIHLRYYLEDWMDLLMGWIKYRFIPDLIYWRGEFVWDNPERLKQVFSELGKYEYFERLRLRFEGEIKNFGGISPEDREPPKRLPGLRDEDAD